MPVMLWMTWLLWTRPKQWSVHPLVLLHWKMWKSSHPKLVGGVLEALRVFYLLLLLQTNLHPKDQPRVTEPHFDREWREMALVPDSWKTTKNSGEVAEQIETFQRRAASCVVVVVEVAVGAAAGVVAYFRVGLAGAVVWEHGSHCGDLYRNDHYFGTLLQCVRLLPFQENCEDLSGDRFRYLGPLWWWWWVILLHGATPFGFLLFPSWSPLLRIVYI
mmetsp:Transcript_1409/g.3869  ORF Transcript_1409/g.3869 Transcript_1409/m.3869 type:complete len:217 (-) Transcript_1409:132-782(-)